MYVKFVVDFVLGGYRMYMSTLNCLCVKQRRRKNPLDWHPFLFGAQFLLLLLLILDLYFLGQFNSNKFMKLISVICILYAKMAHKCSTIFLGLSLSLIHFHSMLVHVYFSIDDDIYLNVKREIRTVPRCYCQCLFDLLFLFFLHCRCEYTNESNIRNEYGHKTR